MRAREFLFEAMGGMFDRYLEKRSGAKIQFEKNGQLFDLVEVAVFPQDERLAYEKATPENPVTPTDAMKADIDQYLSANKAKVEKYVGGNNQTGAAMLVLLSDGKQSIALVKFYKAKRTTHPPLYWQTSEFQRDTGWTQTAKGKSATAKAAELKISPYDFVTPEQRYQISQVPRLIQANLASRQNYSPELVQGIPALLNDVLNGPNKTPIPNIEQHSSTIEVVLGETAAPLALSTGNRVSGSYTQAEQQLISKLEKGATWKTFSLVEFGAHGAAIGDSTLYTPKGTSIIVSSKNAAGGAPASLTGAMETIKKFPEDFGEGTQFYTTYAPILKVLEILDAGTAVSGVVNSCVYYQWISPEEAKVFESTIYGKGKMDPNTLAQYQGLNALYQIPRRVNYDNPKYQLGYHILSNMALKLKQELNQNKPMITSFFKGVLNKASMVQVYTKMGQNDKGIWFDNFDVVWPPTFTGNIVIESDYYTAQARPSKKISFYFTG